MSLRPSTRAKSKSALLAAAVLVGLLAIAASIYLRPQPTADQVALPAAKLLLDEHSQLPVVSYSFEYDRNGMPSWITPSLAIARSVVAFSRFDEYRLIPKQDNNDEFIADYKVNLFFSSAISGNNLDVFVTIYQALANEILWSNRFTFSEPEPGGEIDNLNRVGKIVSSVMSPYGILYDDIINRSSPPPRLNCIRQIYDYFAKTDLQSFSTGFQCASEAIAGGRASSSMHAMLSFLHVEAYRRTLSNVSTEPPLVEARRLANKAIELNEVNARAFQALFAVEKTSGNEDLAVNAAQRAIGLNPFDRDILGDYAAYLISIGKLEKAREPLRRATELTPNPPAWLQFYQYLHADLTGNEQIADQVVKATTVEKSPLMATAMILAFERSGDKDLLDRGVNILNEIDSNLLDNPQAAFLRRGFSEEMADLISDRLERAKASKRFTERASEQRT